MKRFAMSRFALVGLALVAMLSLSGCFVDNLAARLVVNTFWDGWDTLDGDKVLSTLAPNVNMVDLGTDPVTDVTYTSEQTVVFYSYPGSWDGCTNRQFVIAKITDGLLEDSAIVETSVTYLDSGVSKRFDIDFTVQRTDSLKWQIVKILYNE